MMTSLENYSDKFTLFPGQIQDLYCVINKPDNLDTVYLICPLSPGLCMINCKNSIEATKDINCKIKREAFQTIIHYRIKTFPKYQGSWKCQIRNVLSKPLFLMVKRDLYIQSFKYNPNPIIEHEMVTLSCSVLKLENEKLTFSIYTIELNTNKTLKLPSVQLDNWNVNAVIHDSNWHKHSAIECLVLGNSGLKTSKRISTNIYHRPIKAIINVTGIKYQNEVGDILSIECSSLGGYPIPQYSIYIKRDGEHPKAIFEENIVLLKEDNGATIVCRALTPQITGFLESEPIKLSVIYPPENLELASFPLNNIVANEKFKLVCLTKTGSNPPSKIHWSFLDKDGVNKSLSFLDSNTQTIDRPYGETITSSELIFIAKKIYNGLNIKCRAIYRNNVVKESQMNFNVIYGPDQVNIISKPNGLVMENTRVILSCYVSESNPTSIIKWTKTVPGKISEDLTEQTSTNTMTRNDGRVVVLYQLSVSDTARNQHNTEYKCMASHLQTGMMKSDNYILNITYSATVTISASSNQIKLKDKIKLKCNIIQGNPKLIDATYTWKVCPTVFFPESKEKEESKCKSLSNYQPTLTLLSVLFTDRGWYQCYVTDSSKVVSYGEYLLDIEYAPKLLSNYKEKMITITKSTIKFEVRFSANPFNSDVKWFFILDNEDSLSNWNDNNLITSLSSSTLITSGGRLHSEINSHALASLSISDIVDNDFGLYVCQISNHLGFVNSYFWLVSEYSSTIPQSSIKVIQQGQRGLITFQPPQIGHYSHIMLSMCEMKSMNNCKDIEIKYPNTGTGTTSILSNVENYEFFLTVFQDSEIRYRTDSFSTSKSKISPSNPFTLNFTVFIIICCCVALLMIITIVLIVLVRKYKIKNKKTIVCGGSSFSGTPSNPNSIMNYQMNPTLMKGHSFLRSSDRSQNSILSQGMYKRSFLPYVPSEFTVSDNRSHTYVNMTPRNRSLDAMSHISPMQRSGSQDTKATFLTASNPVRLQRPQQITMSDDNKTVSEFSFYTDNENLDSFGKHIMHPDPTIEDNYFIEQYPTIVPDYQTQLKPDEVI